MIDRYARPRMKQVWSDERKYDLWLRVELAVGEAWAAQGVIPPEDMACCAMPGTTLGFLRRSSSARRHDMTAFTRSITQNLGPEGRWVHLGLTSNDIIDTAQNIQMAEAAGILAEDLEDLLDALSNPGCGVQGHANDGPDPRCSRRANHLWTETGPLA